ncbi:MULTISPECIES: hypothetical protein [Leeuwenhoekiella]|jgi:hypothetical protein|uniref:Uncharacterized protein n=1 Tax=Leeuwenhoekiella blandensis (strain CECT 7118 / CCUG 51940 / KCTC 22103 / MED217) TaxID=398720 RepID=A3XP09_LEEBM|nr:MULTISPECIES: hypothetical protein [Leeuwenhoekiella]EAQ48708.1 hypothetical protein MED217_09175 [Leeuwenhoekiella blandensis MED217]MAO45092.1 hypothetical protein [Leeuwenhoekiella sp.]HCW63147.1 hypothetical protein [Leeuwenhoekiella sp.]|tara:strand:+ start:2380 stop:3219 length:840 start_codon:yes stop_codon:yes gene_type:complete
MAKPTSNIGAFKGTIDGITYYTLNGKWVCRKAAPPTEERINTDPRYEEVRKNNKEFGGASSYAKAIRMGLLPYVHQFKDHSFNSRLTSRCLELVKAGRGVKGERSLNACNAPETLVGLELNKHNKLSDRLRFQPKLDADAISVLVDFAGLKKEHLVVPEHATHFDLLLIRYNLMPFTYDQKRQQYTSELDPEALEIVRMLTPPIAIDDIPQPLEFNLPFYSSDQYTWAYLEDPNPMFSMKTLDKKTAHTVWLGIRFGQESNDILEAFPAHNAMQCLAIY